MNTPSPETLARLAAVVGPAGVIVDVQDMAPYLVEWRGLWQGETPLILRPKTTEEVSALLAIAHETQTAVVPQSGNTGLVGAQSPSKGEVLVSLNRMTRIRNIDAADFAITVEAGVTLKAVQDAATDVDRLFPLSLASEGSCRIGGNLGSNAGGVNVLAYGNMRDLCLGLEVVLADGRVLNLLKTLRKDNTGYDLKNIFVGSEGTLGVITAATLKLFPRPRRYETLLLALASPEHALQALGLARQHSGASLVACEVMPEIGMQFTERHMGTTRPFATLAPWYLLLEMADPPEGTADVFVAALAEAGLMLDGTIAQSESQRQALWALRENLSEAQRFEGGSIKHDVAVPVSSVPAFIAEALAAVEAFLPGVRPCCFGHLGDGNMHFNVSQPLGMDKQAYLARWHDMNHVVHDIVARHKGSFSAEHGIGKLKREDMRRYKSQTELEVMRGLKQLFDPKGILNPGRVLPD
jgi:FAD/FMN-containing dehydrogenase